MNNADDLLQGIFVIIFALAAVVARDVIHSVIAGSSISSGFTKTQANLRLSAIFVLVFAVVFLMIDPRARILGGGAAILTLLVLRPLPWRGYGLVLLGLGVVFMPIYIGIYSSRTECGLKELLLFSECGFVYPWQLGAAYGFLLSGVISIFWGHFRGPLQPAPGLRSHTRYHDADHEIVIPEDRR